eukprot:2743391-Amphidinium_carterae.1
MYLRPAGNQRRWDGSAHGRCCAARQPSSMCILAAQAHDTWRHTRKCANVRYTVLPFCWSP